MTSKQLQLLPCSIYSNSMSCFLILFSFSVPCLFLCFSFHVVSHCSPTLHSGLYGRLATKTLFFLIYFLKIKGVLFTKDNFSFILWLYFVYVNVVDMYCINTYIMRYVTSKRTSDSQFCPICNVLSATKQNHFTSLHSAVITIIMILNARRLCMYAICKDRHCGF